MAIPLDKNVIFEKMVEILDKKCWKYNREMLVNYVAMKIPATKLVKGIYGGKDTHRSSISEKTLKYWCECYLAKYNT